MENYCRVKKSMLLYFQYIKVVIKKNYCKSNLTMKREIIVNIELFDHKTI